MQFIIRSPKHGTFKILIDKEDYKKVENLGLYIHRIGKYYYVRTQHNNKQALHRVLMSPVPAGYVVDHINRNTLDNRKRNLRVTTIQGNLENQLRENNKTGKTGVSIGWKGKYTAQIKVNYKKIHLGTFGSLKEASKARLEAEKLYFGKHTINS